MASDAASCRVPDGRLRASGGGSRSLERVWVSSRSECDISEGPLQADETPSAAAAREAGAGYFPFFAGVLS